VETSAQRLGLLGFNEFVSGGYFELEQRGL